MPFLFTDFAAGEVGRGWEITILTVRKPESRLQGIHVDMEPVWQNNIYSSHIETHFFHLAGDAGALKRRASSRHRLTWYLEPLQYMMKPRRIAPSDADRDDSKENDEEENSHNTSPQPNPQHRYHHQHRHPPRPQHQHHHPHPRHPRLSTQPATDPSPSQTHAPPCLPQP